MSNESFIEILVKERRNIISQIKAIDVLLGVNEDPKVQKESRTIESIIIEAMEKIGERAQMVVITKTVNKITKNITRSQLNFTLYSMVKSGVIKKEERPRRQPFYSINNTKTV